MSTVNNGLDMLLELQALAAKNKSNNSGRTSKSTANADGSQTKSFAEIWNNIKKKQAEWDQLMDNLDIAQYKLALSDSFWSSQADSTRLSGMEIMKFFTMIRLKVEMAKGRISAQWESIRPRLRIST